MSSFVAADSRTTALQAAVVLVVALSAISASELLLRIVSLLIAGAGVVLFLKKRPRSAGVFVTAGLACFMLSPSSKVQRVS